MAEGWSQASASDILSDKGAEYPYVQVHTGPPGAAGTANVGPDPDRLLATWGAPVLATDGASMEMKWTADLEWVAVAASGDPQYVSGWSAASGGTFGWSGQLTADAIVVGNDFRIPAGAYTLRVPIATT